jgi:tetratricopeptide (TPR) repeat protein
VRTSILPRSSILFGLLLLAAACLSSPARADDKAGIDVLYQQMMQLYGQGQYQQALAPAGEIVARTEQTFGPNSAETAASLNNLAELFSRLHRFDDAEPLYRRSLAIREKILPPDHPDIAKSKERLAQLFEARTVAEQLQAEQNRARRPTPSTTPKPDATAQAVAEHNRLIAEANRLNAEAAQLAKKEQWEPALADDLKVLALLEKALPAGDPNIAFLTGNIGQLQARTKQYAAAEASLRRAIDLLAKVRGSDDPDVGKMECSLADVQALQAHGSEAETRYKHCLTILEKTHGANDPEVKRVIDRLGDLYRGQQVTLPSRPFAGDRMAGATGAAGTPAAGRDANAEPAELDKVRHLDRQTSDLMSASRFPEALPVALELQALLERLYGPDNVAVALNLDSLARIYRGLGQQAEADRAAQRGQLIRDIIRAGSRGETVKSP